MSALEIHQVIEHDGKLVNASLNGTDQRYVFPADQKVHLISLPNEELERAEFIASLPEPS